MLPLVRRVPILAVIPLTIGVIAVPWWAWTKNMDFVTPPGEFQLRRIRTDTAAALSKPQSDKRLNSRDDPQREVQSPIKPPPVIDPGDPHAPAPLDAFRDNADKGAKALIELAVHLEEQSGNARALLAWERVLDSCKPDDSQRAAALAGIQRLRPSVAPWSVDPLAKPLVLEAAVNQLTPHPALDGVLEEVARITANSSAGLVKFVPRVDLPDPPQPKKKEKPKPKPKPKPKGKAKAPDEPPPPAPPPPPPRPPLSLQILADGEKAASTGMVELALSEDPVELRREILRGVYRLVASQIAATTDFNPPDPLSESDEPGPALSARITRLSWAEFGKSLQAADRP
jgi:hypothetical protein